MRSKQFLAMIVLALSACSVDFSDDNDINRIGSQLSDVGSLDQSDGSFSQRLRWVDHATRKLRNLNLKTMEFASVRPITLEGSTLYTSARGSDDFDLVFAPRSIEVLRSGKTSQKKNVDFQGTPVSSAYDPTSRLFVMQDDLRSFAFYKLSSKGEIQSSWVGGSLIADNQTILSGDLVGNGQLVLSLSDASMAVVDVAQTISQKKWARTDVAADEKFSWVAGYKNRYAMLASTSNIAVFDSSTKTLIRQESLDGYGIVHRSRGAQPHVVTLDTTNGFYHLYRITDEGAFSKHTFDVTSFSSKIESSVIDAEKNHLIVVVEKDSSTREVLKLRLTDQLVMKRHEVRETKGTSRLSDEYLIILLPSALGRVMRLDIDSGEIKELQMFNKDELLR